MSASRSLGEAQCPAQGAPRCKRSILLCSLTVPRGRAGTSHTLHKAGTRQPDTRSSSPPTPNTGRGVQAGRHRCHQLPLWALRSPSAHPPRWDGTIGESSPLPVQWGCSPLQLRCQPGAGGNRPAGSSKMQDWAQPPAGRRERGGAPGRALLVGARGTRKGNGHQHHRGARWGGCREEGGEGGAPGSLASFRCCLFV